MTYDPYRKPGMSKQAVQSAVVLAVLTWVAILSFLAVVT